MRKRHWPKRVLSLTTALSLAGCQGTDSGNTNTGTHPILDDLPGGEPWDPPPSCTRTPDQLIGEGSRITARFKETHCAKVRLCLKSSAWAGITPSTYIPGIDLVIAFDTTGSMNPYIIAMIRNLQQLISNLEGLTPSLKLGLVQFRDFANKGGSKGDLPFEPVVNLTSDHRAIKDALGALKAKGGGDHAESLATALKAIADGQALPPYFGASDIGFSEDKSRVKVILAITDAKNKNTGLPAGAPTLEQAMEVLKQKGVMVLGIGRKDNPAFSSYEDLSVLAKGTGAVVRAPGVDLNGDGLTTAPGELNAGDPAVLQMNGVGALVGAGNHADPTRVLADAIAAMVRQTRPLIFTVATEANGRSYVPASNQLTIAPGSTDEACFADYEIEAKTTAYNACPSDLDFTFMTSEETSGTPIAAEDLRYSWETRGCAAGGDPGTDTVTATATDTGTSTDTDTGSDTGTGTEIDTGSGTDTGTGTGTVIDTGSSTDTSTGIGTGIGV